MFCNPARPKSEPKSSQISKFLRVPPRNNLLRPDAGGGSHPKDNFDKSNLINHEKREMKKRKEEEWESKGRRSEAADSEAERIGHTVGTAD